MRFAAECRTMTRRYWCRVRGIGFATVLIITMALRGAGAAESSAAVAADTETVGAQPNGRVVTPVNQVLTPAGRQIDLPRLRPLVVAMSPDGNRLITAGKTNEILVIDPVAGTVVQRVALPRDDERVPRSEPPSENLLKPDRDGQVSYTGLRFSPDGRRLYMSNVEGSIKVFAVPERGNVYASHAIPLPPANAPRRQAEIPSGLVLNADGSRLYVCGNLSNRVWEIDTANGAALRSFDVGVAPYDLVLVGSKLYVSNWGGRRPTEGDLTGPAGRGTLVRVDPVRFIANEGSVSVIDLSAGRVLTEVMTGLHASGLAVSPNKKYVVCANAGSDHLSVISTENDTVIETIWAKPKPSDLLGAGPNAICFDPSGERLFVANGSQNAVAVLGFEPEERGESRLLGMIPVGWYPGALWLDSPRQTLVVANIKGLPKEPQPNGETKTLGFNSHQYSGSISLVPLPPDDVLPELARIVTRNLRSERIQQALLPARPDQPPRAIPERIGEPSSIKHVVYIIKENRTYDQVLGAFGRGNGEPKLCVFGEKFTPNQHRIARDFVLLDNTYCAGILSADGHQWSTTAFSTDYMEKSFAGFPRSYPDGMGEDENDALAYSPAGFLWDNVVKHGKTIRNYGEFMSPAVRWRDATRRDPINYGACYRCWKDQTQDIVFSSFASVDSLIPFSPVNYVGWEMSVPDQFRADFILRELKQYEAKGEYPQLVIICLPNDHTSGTSPGEATPAACVADNDLAFGRILEGLSHSRFWNDMAVFSIEDDPQAGWDHVSGYRTIAFCAGPYVKRQAIVSTQYNTTSILRTIEQILGIPPMNQFDASAMPMFDCFVDTPDMTPYDALPANVSLGELNPSPNAIRDEVLQRDALVSASLNFREVDRAPEDVLNQILWRAMRGSQDPYPAWAVTVVDDEEEEEEHEADEQAE